VTLLYQQFKILVIEPDIRVLKYAIRITSTLATGLQSIIYFYNGDHSRRSTVA